MCGIAGVLGLGVDLGGPDKDELRGMTAVLHHRGPDGRRHVWMPRCALGNTRLQILDLSERGALPMPNAEGQAWISLYVPKPKDGEAEQSISQRAAPKRD